MYDKEKGYTSRGTNIFPLAVSVKKLRLVIRHIFPLVDMITKAKFSNSPNDFKIHLFG